MDASEQLPKESEIFAGIQGRNTSDYVMRTAQQHAVQLSTMADIKANIIITVCSIVLSLSVAHIDKPEIRGSLLILSVFSLFALLLAVLAVLPKMRHYHWQPGDPKPKNFNIMFFSHFADLPEDEFMREMAQALKQDKMVYYTLVRDLYAIGVYLDKHKYRYLRYSYIFFLGGFIFSSLHQAFMMLFH